MDNVNGHRQVTHVPDHGLVHFVTSATRLGPETTAQANDSEWRVAGVSREIASRAPEIAAGRQRSRDLRGSADKSRQKRFSPAVERVRGAVVSGPIKAM